MAASKIELGMCSRSETDLRCGSHTGYRRRTHKSARTGSCIGFLSAGSHEAAMYPLRLLI